MKNFSGHPLLGLARDGSFRVTAPPPPKPAKTAKTTKTTKTATRSSPRKAQAPTTRATPTKSTITPISTTPTATTNRSTPLFGSSSPLFGSSSPSIWGSSTPSTFCLVARELVFFLMHDTYATLGIPQQPITWKYSSNSPAFGICIDKVTKCCWLGNQEGQVIGLDSVGNEILHRMKLPAGVKCIGTFLSFFGFLFSFFRTSYFFRLQLRSSSVSDMHWRYAACDDGKVYDLTTGVPRVAYEIPRALPKHKEIVFLLDYSGSMSVSETILF